MQCYSKTGQRYLYQKQDLFNSKALVYSTKTHRYARRHLCTGQSLNRHQQASICRQNTAETKTLI